MNRDQSDEVAVKKDRSEQGRSGQDRSVQAEAAVRSDGAAAGMTLAEARAELDGKQGRSFWKGLDKVASEPGFDRMVEREFPQHAQEWVDPVSRRGFMKLMGASLALAGLAGCTKQPDEPIYPYIKQPEDLILGRPTYFATAFPFPTGAIPLLVKSDAYRPIKVDGNPEHPMSKGGSDPFSQGSLLGLYDPDRSQRVVYRGESSMFPNFQNALLTALAGTRGSGQGLYVLSATVTSPTLAAQWAGAQKRFPQAKFVQYDPVNRDSARAASKMAFGDFYDTQYMLDKADVIVTLDADFLSGIAQPGFIKLAGDYANRRKLMDPSITMNRLYAIESVPSTTGFKADHRLAMQAGRIAAFAQALAGALGTEAAGSGGWSDGEAKFLQVAAADLKANGGKCVVIPGEQQSPEVHLAAIAMNQALGNVGKTVVYTATVNPMPSVQMDDLRSLVADMNSGKVQWLLILDANPVYSSPADLQFAEALGRVPNSMHLGSHFDETAQITTWHINSAHYLEMWSDARAYDGTASIVQPLIAPLYGGKSAHEVLQTLLDDPQQSAFVTIKNTWAQQLGKGDFETNWRKALHDGFIENTAFQPKSLSAKASASQSAAATAPSAAGSYEVTFRPDPTVYDGRFSNIGWLQELPKPVTNAAWDNTVMMSQRTLAKIGAEESDVLEITLEGKKVRGSALAVPGHPDGSLTLTVGYGRQHAGRVGSGMGYNAFLIRPSGAPLFATGATVKKTGDRYEVALTKSHYSDTRGKRALAGAIESASAANSLEGDEALTRGIVRYATLEEFRKSPGFAHEGIWPEDPEPDTSMFANFRYDKNAWGLAVDQNSCVGCNACVVSCYAENNIPVVGKHNVKTGRDMQWLRIDTYFEGDLEAPRAHFQPMMCQHCENAPCEQVCPVGATVHSPEGLNVMVYNRCVGTRYCSNNCPYKVRRFNFLLFSDYETESLKLMRNPDVTVRSRGVMEKCTYCLQRIAAAKIHADKENRAIRDGEIVTACQQACPTDAIVFGNINDRTSRVAKIKAQQRNYGVIADMNTRPRTSYIAEVINPNAALSGGMMEPASQEG
ncbi:MAG: TAT-variant-translocated molybdopterin oxidoreductase [Acidobacteriaceae bacterium]